MACALRKGRIVTSLVSRRRYRVIEALGRGGFGVAYHAARINRAGRPMDDVCLKTTRDQASWHREAYFGEALRGNRRVIQLLDAFPLVLKARGHRDRVLFCLVIELAEHGAVADYLRRTRRPWSARRARREVMALLKVLAELHDGSVTHRDLTPDNIFVCARGTLKLGDFGIARQQLGRRAQPLDAVNEGFVSRRVRVGKRPRWSSVDDVFQMGQVLAMLLLGEADAMVTGQRLRRLDCGDPALEAVVRRAIGRRASRYRHAQEMLAALAAL